MTSLIWGLEVMVNKNASIISLEVSCHLCAKKGLRSPPPQVPWAWVLGMFPEYLATLLLCAQHVGPHKNPEKRVPWWLKGLRIWCFPCCDGGSIPPILSFFISSFFFFFFFDCACGMQKVPGPGMNLSNCSDNTESLTTRLPGNSNN